MKMLNGVLAGLVVGAAVVFAALAVMSIVTGRDSCAQVAPQAWSIRLDVPVAMLEEQLPAEPIPVGAGELHITGVSGTECGGVLVVGDWAYPDGPELDNVGLELALDATADGIALRPRTLWFGRLPVDLGWLPDGLWQPLLAGADAQLQATLAGSLAQSGMQACGAAGDSGAVSVYLCEGNAAN